jgi:hypothetical protein
MLRLFEMYRSDIKFWMAGNSRPVIQKGSHYYVFDENKGSFRCGTGSNSLLEDGLYFDDREEKRFLMELEERSFYA